jgi:hypothetical protein
MRGRLRGESHTAIAVSCIVCFDDKNGAVAPSSTDLGCSQHALGLLYAAYTHTDLF